MIAAMSYMSALFVNMYDNLYYMFEVEIKFFVGWPVYGVVGQAGFVAGRNGESGEADAAGLSRITYNFSRLLNRATIFQQ
ncbi:hypothetical protein [Agrobacterium tomkonis]|uniref:hypothetical protein n=1 Tax=Agrobacterium tomkonis TaxID=1183410 RepID=UPI001CD92496|nr:hypothetical protein [Agrobacterium tomkonis]